MKILMKELGFTIIAVQIKYKFTLCLKNILIIFVFATINFFLNIKTAVIVQYYHVTNFRVYTKFALTLL